MVRYGVVSLVVSIAYSLAVVVLVHDLPTHNPVWASGVAFFVMQPVAYLAHRSIAFFDAVRDPFQPLRFAVTATSTFLIAVLIAVGGMYVVTDIYGRSYLLGIALNWALIPAANFLIYLFWVFRVAIPEAASAPP